MNTAKHSRLILYAIILFASQCRAGTILPAIDTAWNRFIANFQMLPEYHLEADVYLYFFQKNAYFKTRYYLEADPQLSFSLVSFRKQLYLIFDFDFELGMGQSIGNIVFDPMDINFNLVPILELRRLPLVTQIGIEHRCYHEIDRKDFPTIYLNKIFLAAGSRNFRLSQYRAELADNGWAPRWNRFSWYLRWGYFMKEFFGLVDPGKINGFNDKIYEFSTDVRYAFYRRRSWILNVRYKAAVGQYEKTPGTTVFWRNDFSLESSLRAGIRGGMLFARYTLDDIPTYQEIPRLSRDRMLQVGIKFYY